MLYGAYTTDARVSTYILKRIFVFAEGPLFLSFFLSFFLFEEGLFRKGFFLRTRKGWDGKVCFTVTPTAVLFVQHMI